MTNDKKKNKKKFFDATDILSHFAHSLTLFTPHRVYAVYIYIYILVLLYWTLYLCSLGKKGLKRRQRLLPELTSPALQFNTKGAL